jgi:hypothetical protein
MALNTPTATRANEAREKPRRGRDPDGHQLGTGTQAGGKAGRVGGAASVNGQKRESHSGPGAAEKVEKPAKPAPHSADSRMAEILERRKREAIESRKERAKNMPACADFVRVMREHFPDLKVLYASENGHEWGEPQAQGVPLSDSWKPHE